MKHSKGLLFLTFMLVLTPFVLSADLSYDSDKNTLTFEYDGLNRVINQSSTSNEIVYSMTVIQMEPLLMLVMEMF